MKFLDNYLYYVRNTKDIIRYDIRRKTASLIGTAKDAILAIYVTKNKIREMDKSPEERKKEELNHIGIQIKSEEVKGADFERGD
jgi:hypothetical protein